MEPATQPTPLDHDEYVDFSTTRSSLQFFRDPYCTSPIIGVFMRQGTASKTFYMKDSRYDFSSSLLVLIQASSHEGSWEDSNYLESEFRLKLLPPGY
jgi:hypothetical protein